MNRAIAVSAAVLVTVAALLALFYLYAVNPGENGHGIACSTYRIFGVYCPGCGLTRQMHCALHGDFLLAFSYNPMGVVIWPMLLVVYIVFIRWAVWDKPLPNLPLWTVFMLAGVFLVYMILRNLPFEPFSALAPPA